MKALIDGDSLIMKAGFANEKSSKGVLLSVNPVHFAYHTVKLLIRSILRGTKCDDYTIYIADTSKKHFRYRVAITRPYKENRIKRKRPEHEKQLRSYISNYYNTEIVSGVEVDDALGIQQTKNTIICSNDKDLNQIPGWHYDYEVGTIRNIKGKPVTMKAYMKKKFYHITDPGFLALRKNGKILVGGGQMWFAAQLLSGDTTDTIPGVAKGFGPKTIYNILNPCRTYEDAIKTVWWTYKDVLTDLTEEQVRTRLKEVAQLCWIKRAEHETIFPKEWLQ